MKADGQGSMINVSSVAAIQPGAGGVAVDAGAKARANTITAGFAKALGPEVRVNTIDVAGPFLTDINSKAWDVAAFETHAQDFPLRRGRPTRGEIVRGRPTSPTATRAASRRGRAAC